MTPHFHQLSIEALALPSQRLFVGVGFNVLLNDASRIAGGKALLAFLEGKERPGIAALTAKRP